MAKALYIAEKPSVAQEFAKALKINGQRRDGYLESENSIVTWCVGHLVTMSYPEKYDIKYKRWSFDTLPFLPRDFKYEVIPAVAKQFRIVQGLLNRSDVDTIYVCTDSGREGEYIYRLVAQEAHVTGKNQKRVWIDSQTEEEILRGIREAKDLSAYDALAASAYLRAKEDYLMGINFSRALSLRYGNQVSRYLGSKYQAIAVGRVMTCVLGMVVRREREIRSFVKTPFYRVVSHILLVQEGFDGEWRAVEGSRYDQSPKLYKENGFKKKEDAQELIAFLSEGNASVPDGLPKENRVTCPEGKSGGQSDSALQEASGDGSKAEPKNQDHILRCMVQKIERKKETKNAPLLFNLAELQNVCSKLFKISPDETLRIVQELYEKKLVTYPRTDARVLSTAVAKEIRKNIAGLKSYDKIGNTASDVLAMDSWKTIAKTRYTNDKQITDHYAIIPTGQGLGALNGLSLTAQRVYETIVRRFLCIFYPPAVYQKVNLVTGIKGESFFSAFKVLVEEGYLKIAANSFARSKNASAGKSSGMPEETKAEKNASNAPEQTEEEEMSCDANLLNALQKLKKGDLLPVGELSIKEGETSPPKRYNSGSMILAMENAGQLIEDEDLRAQIKGSGIGTSATRAEILKKLFTIHYLDLNKKTQIITPTQLGEMVYDVVYCSIRQLLNPELTASWEKGLTYVAEGTISSAEYMDKLEHFVRVRTNQAAGGGNTAILQQLFDAAAPFYKTQASGKKRTGKSQKSTK